MDFHEPMIWTTLSHRVAVRSHLALLRRGGPQAGLNPRIKIGAPIAVSCAQVCGCFAARWIFAQIQQSPVLLVADDRKRSAEQRVRRLPGNRHARMKQERTTHVSRYFATPVN